MGKIPLNCKLCKKFLQDEDLIGETGKPYACDIDGELTSTLIGFGCEYFKLGKWALVEYLGGKKE